MQTKFISIDEFFDSFEVELLNLLYDYGLLEKFDKTAKKVILYVFIQKLNDLLHDKSVLLYSNKNLASTFKILNHFPHDKLNQFIVQICFTVKKHTKRLIFVSPKTTTIDSKDIDGEIVDELILLQNQKEPDLKKLKDFLVKHNLKDMFASISTKI